ncbi:MAG: polyprenyl synthetase family protein [Candidatus Saccharimonadales bacterium]
MSLSEQLKSQIDADIDSYARSLRTTTLQQYGPTSQQVIDAYLAILQRGGKRIRGALTIVGYQMMGGQDQAMIIQAARAMEMIHAYLLIIDDIQDRSQTRRGGPTAHLSLAETYKDAHIGQALAINAALLGSHAAQMILANLDVAPLLRSNVLSILSRTLLVTFHGQTLDLVNQVKPDVSLKEVEQVMDNKTAHYSFLNPLHVGMVLAGADCQATDAITPYALAAGRAFQISDDILGVFGDQKNSGKNPQDDIREGKRTLLTVYALQKASPAGKLFLQKSLGNDHLTNPEFTRCQQIITDTGARKYAQAEATKSIQEAVSSIQAAKQHWSADGQQYLLQLVKSLQNRIA